MVQERGLSIRRLHRHKPHAQSPDRLANRLSVRSVGLAAPNIGFDIGGRDQSHLVPEGCDQTSPVMRGGASLDPNQAGRKTSKKVGDLASLQLAAHDNLACDVNSVDLEHALGEIETDGANLHGGRLLSVWRSSTTTS
jgi:hypothetical protein